MPIWLGREIYCPEQEFVVPRKKKLLILQALKSLGVETQLVIYPDQFHGLTIPIYPRDRLERYLAWYDKHLKEDK